MRKHKHSWGISINPHLLICVKKTCKDLKPKNPGIFYSRRNIVFTHFCLPSPIGLCSYNLEEDPNGDDCIYCHQPYERK